MGFRGVTSDDIAALLRGEGKTKGRHIPLRIDGPPSYSSVRDSMKATVTTEETESVVGVFDLAGFTSFCSQTSTPSQIPTFLNSFLEWLFARLDQGTAAKGVAADPLWQEPPFFAKFLGDGILLLWDARNMVDRQVARLVTLLLDICNCYRAEFYVKASRTVKTPPQSLRCRVARGSIFSVNNGRDYVGHCINLAVHLHDYKVFSFAVAADGFNPSETLEASVAPQMQLLSIPTKGIKTNPPVWVLKREVELLRAKATSA